jgi:hypothetical protein
MLGVLYVPQEKSKFLNDDDFLQLDHEISITCSEFKHTILLGDMNARTATLPDFTCIDDFCADIQGIDPDTLSTLNKSHILTKCNVPLSRKSVDKKTNSNGLALVDICRNNNLFILNGRMGTDKDTGQFTYRNSSVIDYAIATAECFVFLTEFGIIETDSLFSDGHAIIKFTVSSKTKVTPPHKQKLHKDNTSAKWKQNLASSFINNINEENIDHIKYLCDVCPCAPSSIDEITNTITVMFQNAAAETFPKQCSYNHAFKRPWFGIKCKQAQTCYYEAKNIYTCERSLSNKTLLQNHGR